MWKPAAFYTYILCSEFVVQISAEGQIPFVRAEARASRRPRARLVPPMQILRIFNLTQDQLYINSEPILFLAVGHDELGSWRVKGSRCLPRSRRFEIPPVLPPEGEMLFPPAYIQIA